MTLSKNPSVRNAFYNNHTGINVSYYDFEEEPLCVHAFNNNHTGIKYHLKTKILVKLVNLGQNVIKIAVIGTSTDHRSLSK